MELLSCHMEAKSIIGHAHVIIYVETTVKDPVEAINSVIDSLQPTVAPNEICMRTRGQRHLLAFLQENGFKESFKDPFPSIGPTREELEKMGRESGRPPLTLDKG